MELQPSSSICALWVLASGLASTPALAHASEGAEPSEPNEHGLEHRNLVGARIGYVSAVRDDGGELNHAPAVLVGISYERVVRHGWLEVEVAVPAKLTFGPEPFVSLPIDLHLKKPFHPSPTTSPYVALGPASEILVYPRWAGFLGGSVAIGTYVWGRRRTGLDVEIDYNLVVEDGHPVHEIMLAVGPVFRM